MNKADKSDLKSITPTLSRIEGVGLLRLLY